MPVRCMIQPPAAILQLQARAWVTGLSDGGLRPANRSAAPKPQRSPYMTAGQRAYRGASTCEHSIGVVSYDLQSLMVRDGYAKARLIGTPRTRASRMGCASRLAEHVRDVE